MKKIKAKIDCISSDLEAKAKQLQKEVEEKFNVKLTPVRNESN